MKQENGEGSTGDQQDLEPTSDELATTKMTALLNLKKGQWEAIKKKTGPLRLLDLPVDILRLIVKEVTYTNNLNSLAMTNSTLYNLAVPLIYARFDIVWPDTALTSSQQNKGVDALTYGLSTLSLGSKFAQMTRWLRRNGSETGEHSSKLTDSQYAKYTRKFCLGNGPSDLISEYMITKENGKMLGTLVALAVAKMVNLDTFVWDMPTGVLSDIFMSLASLQMPDGTANLEKVWIRWHDNSATGGNSTATSSTGIIVEGPPGVPGGPVVVPAPPIPAPAPAPTNLVINAQPPNSHPARTTPVNYSESTVEYPTFSILPPLKSLTVLDIDEISYLDEMAILIERSKSKLEELQIGISAKTRMADFARAWDDHTLQQVDFDARWPGENRIGDRRLGGVLGVLMGRIYDVQKRSTSKRKENEPSSYASSSSSLTRVGSVGAQASSSKILSNGRRRLDGKLRLKTLSLERVAIHPQVCTRAIDWTVLTSLTILDCTYHETLWKVLRKQFQPVRMAPRSSSCSQMQFHLALKHIHTDTPSESLISFIKETLAPNTLEALFLQDKRSSNPPGVLISIPVGRIFKGAIKRHRLSLRKLLLDSSARRQRGADARRWTNWMLTSEVVSYITSGRMSNLRELAVALHYKDWHHFLQRLPNIPQLRSLYLSNIDRHIMANSSAKEIALQLVDIVALRPQLQLCYVGIKDKCFEIMETPASDGDVGPSTLRPGGHVQGNHTEPVAVPADDDDHFSESEGGMETEDDDDNDGTINANVPAAANIVIDDSSDSSSDDTASDVDVRLEGDDEGEDYFKSRFRLREILFYDDRIAIFKARHGRL